MDWPLHHLHRPHPKALRNVICVVCSGSPKKCATPNLDPGGGERFFLLQISNFENPPHPPGIPYSIAFALYVVPIWLRRKHVTFTKPCACAAKCITFLAWHTIYHFYANCNRMAAQTDTWHIHGKSLFRALPNGRAIGAGFDHLRLVEDGCEHVRTVANTKTTSGEHSSTLRLPNENPSLRIREKEENMLENNGSHVKPIFFGVKKTNIEELSPIESFILRSEDFLS